ncbi:hypothetical protein HOD29_04500 [archaeon]|jgi:hypothetical protein|nr:hypothetical protein [archaeon]
MKTPSNKIPDQVSIPNEVLVRIFYQEVLEEIPLTEKECERKYKISEENFIDKGKFGRVYSIGNKKVAKRTWRGIGEFSRLKLLNKLGKYTKINSPKAYELVLEEGKNDYIPLIIMENLGKSTILNEENNGNVHATRLYSNQIKKLRKYTTDSWDDYRANGMWHKNKAYIIDPDLIDFKGIEKLEKTLMGKKEWERLTKLRT